MNTKLNIVIPGTDPEERRTQLGNSISLRVFFVPFLFFSIFFLYKTKTSDASERKLYPRVNQASIANTGEQRCTTLNRNILPPFSVFSTLKQKISCEIRNKKHTSISVVPKAVF